MEEHTQDAALGGSQADGPALSFSNFPPESHPATELPLAYRAVRGGTWVILSSYWTIGFGFLANILLTRLLSPEVFGGYALALFFVALFQLRSKLGLNYAFAQDPATNAESIGTFFFLEIALGLSSLLIVLVAAPILVALGYEQIVVVVCIVLTFVNFTESFTSALGVTLDKTLHFKPMSAVQFIVFPLSYVPAFVLALNGGGVWSLVVQAVSYSLMLQVSGLIIVTRYMPEIWSRRWRFSRARAKRYLRFGSITGLGIFSGSLMTTLDNFYIGTFVGITALGYYDRAYRMAQWPALLFNSISTRVSFFTYARLQNDPQRLEKAVTMMLWLMTILALPIGLMLMVTAPDLLALLYGEKWLSSTPFLLLLAAYSIVRPLIENMGGLFIAIGKPQLTTKVTLFQIITLAVVGLPMTLAFGAIGTSLAVGLALIVGIVLIYFSLRRIMSIQVLPLLGAPVLAAGLTIVGYLVIQYLADLNSVPLLWRTVFKVIYAGGAFYSLVLLIQFKPTLERLNYVRRLLRQKDGSIEV
jgi:lipopolysaccharide exporter